ncbi:phenylalanine--tRNA ligase subunit beta [Mastigocoleus testarum]|uniref:Phenylalanine--tRNA ligase beta subunit n=1 Tax=Mastigocoleus testarum BC008 TaxID=371196 RepID=A0A0V7ZPC7_9CYAN|nr:phenylalanine--tRNA ligase subunit beta [Mastigocoleus testarum]KST66467.1 phenylalanine--tRNA ligase subunit beta [Mastigocoleus testarum BC008]
MRISLNWLRELVELKLNPEELAETLTMAGFEVEDIEDRRTWANGVVVGKVVEREPHPNADKLSVCQVDVGTGENLNIVCGAPNVCPNIYVPVATVGCYLPNIDLKIKPAKLRGVKSYGMICSLKELGLPADVDGIHIFTGEDLQLGSDVRPLLGLDDVVLDVTTTANRADALSMVGVAREVAALTGGQLSLPVPGKVTFSQDTSNLDVHVEDKKACPAYFGTVIEDVKISLSPDWLQQRLRSAGVRPINNVVDITNYVMLEWGQPLHAFDRERLQVVADGKKNITIGVRFANAGEEIKTLDGQTRKLSTQNLLITAGDKPVAIAGVMGGEETEVHEGTQNLVLEAALFDNVPIRRSSRSVGLRSESSGRYERGVNRAELEISCNRALLLLQELTGGNIIYQAVSDSRPDPSNWSRSIELRLERVNKILGPTNSQEENTEVTSEDVERILTTLGCKLTLEDEGRWMVSVPSYRYRDLEREIDLIEEIARLYGYDNFCDTLPEESEAGYLPLDQELKRCLRAAFRAEGLTELMHYSLVKPGESRQVVLANPLLSEYSALRTDLIFGLVNAYKYNLEQGNGDLNGFEIGSLFCETEDGLKEEEAIAGIMGGDTTSSRWTRSDRRQPMTWYEAKGVLESVFDKVGLQVEYQPDCSDGRFHPGRTASLWLGGNKLGIFGQLHPQFRQECSLPDEVYVFQMDLEVLLDALDSDEILVPQFQNYSNYPASDRDLAFYAPVNIRVAEIEKAVTKAGKGLLNSVELFDEYRGENVPTGQRSLAFRLIYRAEDRTLTDTEVEPVHQKVRDTLVEKFGVELRS